MVASVEVTAPIAEGTIVVLRNVEFDADVMAGVVEAMRDLVGHERFLVLAVQGDGDVETWGPDTDLRARVGDLLGAARAQRPVPPPRPGTSTGVWQGPSSRPVPPPRP